MRFALISALLCAAAASVFAQPGSLHLLQKPALSKDLIVFSYASDLWSVPRAGGVARRLTTGQGFETDASFSPDGGTIAFSGEYDGNTDVFTMPAAGGVPKRITFHPGIDRAVGWTPDAPRAKPGVRVIRSCSPWPPRADLPPPCPCRSPAPVRIRLTGSGLFMRRSTGASLRRASPTTWHGNDIAEARPATSGS